MASDPVGKAVASFGLNARAKLGSAVVAGEPEDQLRGPLEALFAALAVATGLPAGAMTMVGETSLADLKSRPDYAVTVRGALVGFIEVKAPGKGFDPRRYKDKHDRAQWEKLRSLPNLLYTDGNGFGLFHNGEPAGLVALDGDVETSGAAFAASPKLLPLIRDFLGWEPIPPRSARELAALTARLCRLLRDEVVEEMALGRPALTVLAEYWRKRLFPDADDDKFADGYAQAVTFGLLMARSRGIPLAGGLDAVAKALGRSETLIGAALRLLTEEAEVEAALKTSLGTLVRVLDVVDWAVIAKGDPEAWLYFYEAFLEVYDNTLRKKTGSYYTPPQVVEAMVRLADDALRDRKLFDVPAGFASPKVTVADPAVGSGTFLLGVLRRIAATVRGSQGEGAVAGAVRAAMARLIGFEIQFGPFAVAQLRLFAELVQLDGAGAAAAAPPFRLFVTDTLSNPFVAEEAMPGVLGVLAQSRAAANRIKLEEAITVVIGNPPYKEKAKGRGGWIEAGGGNRPASPLSDWFPPPAWGAGAHSKHLRNLYVYFWRWAALKVFGPSLLEADVRPRAGIVCFITVSGFLAGPGFQMMRQALRKSCDAIWVIDCSPEGHQPEVATRIFEGVQQPVCIVLAARRADKTPDTSEHPTWPARVRFRTLPKGRRAAKFEALAGLTLGDKGWVDAPDGWREPFLPASAGAWADYPKLPDLFAFSGPGVMPGRTWVVAPDPATLDVRWQRLLAEKKPVEKERLFHPQLRSGKVAARHIGKFVNEHLGEYKTRPLPIADEQGPVATPILYGFRTFDRQWMIPDARLLNDPRPQLWRLLSRQQLFLTAPDDRSPTDGPALSVAGQMPDQHHYAGRGGRVFPLWADAAATRPNFASGLIERLAATYGEAPSPPDLFAYIAALAAHPGYVARFQADLATPGLRVPLTADPALFAEAAALGREVVWLHSFGERFADPAAGRPHGPPRMADGARPLVTRAIPDDPARFPDTLAYDAATRRLHVGEGTIEPVPPAVWAYTVSGKQVLRQWFSYRKKDRERPIIGDRRKPSPLGDIGPDHWLAEYTEELVSVLNVLGRLVLLEPAQADLLARVCGSPLVSAATVAAARPAPQPQERGQPRRRKAANAAQTEMPLPESERKAARPRRKG